MSPPFRKIFGRLGEVALAAIIVGVALIIWTGLTTGSWMPYLLLVAPQSLLFGIMFATFMVRDILMALFLVLTVLAVLLLILVAQRVRPNWLRVALHTLFLAGQVFGMAWLAGLLNLTG